MSDPWEITGLLAQWSRGNQAALNRLVPLVYDELDRLASHCMRGERPDHLLETTALVNEAYLGHLDRQNVSGAFLLLHVSDLNVAITTGDTSTGNLSCERKKFLKHC
jgi:hypothetical protein